MNRIIDKENHVGHTRGRQARINLLLEGDTLARLSEIQLNSPITKEERPCSPTSSPNHFSIDSDVDVDKEQSPTRDSYSLNESSSSSQQYDHSQDSYEEESSSNDNSHSIATDTNVEEEEEEVIDDDNNSNINSSDEDFVLEDDETMSDEDDMTFDEKEEEFLRHSRIHGHDPFTPSSVSIQDFKDSFYTENTNTSNDILSPSSYGNLEKSPEAIVVIHEEDSFNTTFDSQVIIAQVVEDDHNESEDPMCIQAKTMTTQRVTYETKEGGGVKPSDPQIQSLPKVQGVKKGKWTLGSKIGVGSFGVVHVGMNTLTGTLMAVKCIHISSDHDTMEDLEREIHFMKSLSHVHIVRYIGVERDSHKEMLYIFQEWVPGGSVSSLLQKFGSFSMPVIRSYLQQIVLGLQYLHSKNILHRDIKGGNVLVDDKGVVKLADFGASKQMLGNGTLESSSAIPSSRIDDAMEKMSMRGTPYYMAVEVFEEKYGQKADIWSCAGVAYQMLTAQAPWKDLELRSPMSLYLYLKKTVGPPSIPKDLRISIDVNLMDVLNECFDRDPMKRPSATELLEYEFFQDEEEIGEEESYVSPHANKSAKSPPFISPMNRKKLEYKNLDESTKERKKKSPAMLKYDKSEWPEWAKN